MDMTEKKIDGQVLFRGRIITLEHDRVLLPNGREALREVARHPHGVCIAAMDSDHNILFVRQFRYPYLAEIVELPAGKVDKGEDYLAAAKRELMEETGCVADDWRDMGLFYPSPGFTDETLHMYFCRVRSIGQSEPDDDEFVETFTMTLEEAAGRVMAGEIPSGFTQTLILKLYNMYKEGRL